MVFSVCFVSDCFSFYFYLDAAIQAITLLVHAVCLDYKKRRSNCYMYNVATIHLKKVKIFQSSEQQLNVLYNVVPTCQFWWKIFAWWTENTWTYSVYMIFQPMIQTFIQWKAKNLAQSTLYTINHHPDSSLQYKINN